MSNAKKSTKPNPTAEEIQAAVAATLQKLIAQGKKEGMIRAADLNAQLEKLQLTPEKIEEIYRVAQFGLCLTFELRLCEFDGNDRRDALSYIIAF